MSDGTSLNFIGVVLDGSYRIERLIGEGGMGAVFEGTQLRLNKRVAIKLMSRELASNAEALGRFRREAELTSQLGHPNIVQVFDFATAPTGEPYLAMEFLEGEDLDQRLKRVGRLPFGAAASIVKQVASALGATHAKGIVHRDLKPANVFLVNLDGENDFVKILDFGIAKAKVAATRLTRASVVIGTPNYMSPEQATGKVDLVDAASDQWSLGAIAYEMLAGQGPFSGEDVAALLYQIVHTEPGRLSDLVPGIPAPLEKAIMRAMSKRREDRFPSIRDFGRAFEAAAVVAPGSQTVLSGSKGQARINPAPTPRSAAERPKASLTTFSQAAVELTKPLFRIKERMGRGFWGAVAAVAAIAIIIPLATRRSSTSPPSASPPEARPTPAAAPPPATPPPAPVIAPMPTPPAAEVEREPATPKPMEEPKKKRARWVDPFADESPTGARSAPAKAKPSSPAKGPSSSQPASSGKSGAPSRTLSPVPSSPSPPAKPKRRLIKEL
jgi:serine/threonine-protein kinase